MTDSEWTVIKFKKTELEEFDQLRKRKGYKSAREMILSELEMKYVDNRKSDNAVTAQTRPSLISSKAGSYGGSKPKKYAGGGSRTHRNDDVITFAKAYVQGREEAFKPVAVRSAGE